ncbi:MAG: gamma-glutamylcyclotransferase family protein [Candidatus Bathyarchaeia archaeon]
MYYFAYGSNMNHAQMKKRCLTSRFKIKAKLNGYKFVYDGYSALRKGAVANVVRSDGNIVEGGLWEIDEDCLKTLDRYEGYPSFYDRQTLRLEDDNGNSYEAYVYLRKPQELGEPSAEYRKIVLEGARECCLSERYIKEFIGL